MKTQVKEIGRHKGGSYEMSEMNGTNLLLMWRECPKTDKTKVSDVLNWIPNHGFDDVWNALDTKSNIVAYIEQTEGTSSDVVLFDRDGMDTAREVFEAVSKLDVSRKYVDMTSEDDKDFTDAVENISTPKLEL